MNTETTAIAIAETEAANEPTTTTVDVKDQAPPTTAVQEQTEEENLTELNTSTDHTDVLDYYPITQSYDFGQLFSHEAGGYENLDLAVVKAIQNASANTLSVLRRAAKNPILPTLETLETVSTKQRIGIYVTCLRRQVTDLCNHLPLDRQTEVKRQLMDVLCKPNTWKDVAVVNTTAYGLDTTINLPPANVLCLSGTVLHTMCETAVQQALSHNKQSTTASSVVSVPDTAGPDIEQLKADRQQFEKIASEVKEHNMTISALSNTCEHLDAVNDKALSSILAASRQLLGAEGLAEGRKQAGEWVIVLNDVKQVLDTLNAEWYKKMCDSYNQLEAMIERYSKMAEAGNKQQPSPTSEQSSSTTTSETTVVAAADNTGQEPCTIKSEGGMTTAVV